MSSLLNRIAVFSARRRLTVIGVWLVLLVGLGFAASAAGTKYTSSVTVGGSDSAAATDVMARSFSPELTDASPVVFHTDAGKLTDAEHRGVVEESLAALSAQPDVASVTNPLEEGSATMGRRAHRLRNRRPGDGARRSLRRAGRGDPRHRRRARSRQRRAGRGRRPAG